MQKLAEQHAGRVDFAVVYIYEAHPEDGWVVTMNRDQDIAPYQPKNDSEREAIAETCAIRMQIQMPVVIDPIDNKIASAYGALPDRLYLIGKGGHIAFQGEPGPFGFRVEDLAAAIDEELASIGG